MGVERIFGAKNANRFRIKTKMFLVGFVWLLPEVRISYVIISTWICSCHFETYVKTLNFIVGIPFGEPVWSYLALNALFEDRCWFHS